MDYKDWKDQLSEYYINYDGKLSAIIEERECYFNSIRDDNWIGIYLLFNPKNITPGLNW